MMKLVRSTGWVAGAVPGHGHRGRAEAGRRRLDDVRREQWNQRYSGLKDINTKNVSQLVPRAIVQTGIPRLGSFENTPIVVGGKAFVTTPFNTAIAYDLATGKQVWRYEHKLGTTIYCCGPNNRGVGRARPARVHGHPRRPAGRARRARRARWCGTSRWPIRPTATASRTRRSSSDNNVIVGVSGGEYGIRGHVTAYDAVTGKQVWRWYSIPAPKGDPTFDETAPNGWWGTG